MPSFLRVATMKVLGPANPGWERRAPVLAATLRRLAPDVVALQEVPVGTATVDDLLGPGPHVTPFSRAADDGVGGTRRRGSTTCGRPAAR